MNKVIGTVTTQQNPVLLGDHHIVTGVPVADETVAFAEGTILAKGESGFIPYNPSTQGAVPVAVALEPLTAEADDAVIQAAVHGAVRRDKLLTSGGTAATDAVCESLRASGIYAIAGE